MRDFKALFPSADSDYRGSATSFWSDTTTNACATPRLRSRAQTPCQDRV